MKHYFLALCAMLYFPLSAQTIVFPDYHFSNKLQENITLDTNHDGQIQVSEAQAATSLTLNDAGIVDLTGIEYFTNLQSLNCSNNALTNLNLNGLTNLYSLYCDANQLTSLDVSYLPNLQILTTQLNPLTSLNVSGLHLTQLWCYDTNLSQVNVSGMTSLTDLRCYNMPQVVSINAANAVNLTNFATGIMPNLTSLNLSGTKIQELNLLEYNNVSLLQNLNLTNCSQLTSLSINTASLTNLNLSGCSYLFSLSIVNCPITFLNLSDFDSLYNLTVNNTPMTSLSTVRCTNLTNVNVDNNALTFLDLTGSIHIYNVSCRNNQLTTLDVSGCMFLSNVDCSNNQLNSLYIKNGSQENSVVFANNANLSLICADVFQVGGLQSTAGPNVTVTSNCVFSSGSVYNTIAGNFTFDSDTNGCDLNDPRVQGIKVNITGPGNPSSFYTDNTTGYAFYAQTGTFTVTPQFENPAYFAVSPTSVDVPFATPSGNTAAVNFCLTPNGVHPDVEILLLPLSVPRPGFNVLYRLVYKNKGNTVQNGTVNFNFDDAVLDFVTATPDFPVQTLNQYSWTFANLQPFEQREITVLVNLNSGSEIPSVFIGAQLAFSASINGSSADETPADNTFSFNQTVVGSYDPNDKKCLEGNTIDIAKVGDFVHYLIHFENTGNANAENVLVSDEIDLTKFDIGTVIPLSGSHPFVTRISGNNKVEFVFNNIDLPFAAGTNEGYASFKIRTRNDLAIGDSFANVARIFFDYNTEIVTNTATTTISALSVKDFKFADYLQLSPNPSQKELNIRKKGNIEISSMSIYNVLGQLVIAIPNAQQVSTVDVSNLKTGNYFIKINSDKGTTNAKFVKN